MQISQTNWIAIVLQLGWIEPNPKDTTFIEKSHPDLWLGWAWPLVLTIQI